MMTATPKQIVALRLLYRANIGGWSRREVYPATIGYAVCPERKNGRRLRPQGAGRLGGAMGHRLIKSGWAWSTTHGYAISGEGIAELERHECLEPMG